MSYEYNEDAYRDARLSINPNPCAFEKAVLSTCVACTLADKQLLAERETINCRDISAQKTCTRLRHALRTHSAFSLKIIDLSAPVPHGLEIKAQCGGLKGLQHVLTGLSDVADVQGLVVEALEEFGDLDSLPYTTIVQSVVHFSIRKRR